jgi:hypothetical protein
MSAEKIDDAVLALASKRALRLAWFRPGSDGSPVQKKLIGDPAAVTMRISKVEGCA